MKRFSDVVVSLLKSNGAAFAELVCPRKRGEVGVRLPEGVDPQGLQNCVSAALAGRAGSHFGGPKYRLRASGVPLALLGPLHLVVSRLNVDLHLVDQRIVRCGYDFLVADLTVEGVMDSGEVYSLSGLDSHPVVVRRLSSSRPAPIPVRMMYNAPVPAPQRPLTTEATTSWAAKAASHDCQLHFQLPVSPVLPLRHLLHRRRVLHRPLRHWMRNFPS